MASFKFNLAEKGPSLDVQLTNLEEGIRVLKLELIKQRSTYAVETFLESWMVGAKKFFPLMGAWAITLLLPVIFMIIGVFVGLAIDFVIGFKKGGLFTLLGLLIPGALMGWLWPGWMYVCLKIARGVDVKMTDVFRPISVAFSGIVSLAITSVLISIGSILVIPGALLFLKWQLVPFYIVDKGYGPIQAMQQSWHDTDRLFFTLGIMDLLFVGVFMLVSPTVFGPLIMHMGFSMASALVYHKWLTDDNHPDMPKIESEEPNMS